MLKFICFNCREKFSYDYKSKFTVNIGNRGACNICLNCASNLNIDDYKKKYKSFKEVK